MALDLEGVCASSGSACMVGSVVASHVLLALGLPAERAATAIRFSLGKETTADEIAADRGRDRTHRAAPQDADGRRPAATCSRLASSRFLARSFRPPAKKRRAAIRRWKRPRATCSSSRARPRSPRRSRVEWSARLRSAAGRAEFRHTRILLNCRLAAHGEAEIDRTLRHELAHLLAQTRAGRRRIAPHGAEWRRACADLGIAGEARCHNLPFPIRRLQRRYLYACPHCRRDFPRTRPLRRSSACLACCRAFNGGRYDRRFKLQLVRR